MGSTVLAGAATSGFSGVFLALCKSDALVTFGILMITTVLSSLMVALVYLPALFFLMGPNADEGNIKLLILNPLKEWINKKS
jgi:predicted RND superfamily exporter protein